MHWDSKARTVRRNGMMKSQLPEEDEGSAMGGFGTRLAGGGKGELKKK